MSLYEQHIKHWNNHGKDRFVQQCSGYFGEGSEGHSYNEETERDSFEGIVERNMKNEQFPIAVRRGSGGVWFETDINDCFGTVIESVEKLIEFKNEYII